MTLPVSPAQTAPVFESVALSPDGKRLAVAMDDALPRWSIQIWDTASAKVVLELGGHTGVVSGLRFAPDGQRLYSASVDGLVLGWDISDKR